MSRLKEVAPNAEIYWLVNTHLKREIVEGMKTACEFYGIDCIEFKDIEKDAGHPTVQGMQDIKNQIIKFTEK